MSLALKAIRVLKEEGPIILARKGSKFIGKRANHPICRLGSGRTCPICGFSGRKFALAGNPPRQESKCPKCGARERHRLLWSYIENEMELLDSNKNILYFAPTNLIEEKLRENGNIVSTDLTMKNVDINSDITRLPFNTSTFDAIICSHVLEHIPDDRTAMSEMYRVLNPGGEALIMVPKDKDREQTYEDDSITSQEARRKEFGGKNHVRWYGKDFVQRLSDAGFNVSVETYANNFSGETVEKFGLKLHDQYLGQVKYEDIHCCKKPADTEN